MRTRSSARIAHTHTPVLFEPTCSAHRLPDELLREILLYNLHLDDFDLEPDERVPSHADALLLVCRRWLRVGTPVFYRDVVLRSTAQAQALADVLGSSKLGLHIRRMRIEGGYGMPLRKVVACAPNVTDLWVSFDLEKRDSTVGITRIFSMVNPTRFTAHALEYDIFEERCNQREAIEALQDAIGKWTNLVSMTCLQSDVSTSITKAIAGSPALKELHIRNQYPEYRGAFARLLDEPEGRSNSLSAVYFHFTHEGHWLTEFEVDLAKFCPVLHAVSTITSPFSSAQNAIAAASTRTDPSYSPAKRVSAEVWRKIFKFCTAEVTSPSVLWQDMHEFDTTMSYNETQRRLCMVSVAFWEAALPLLYANPAFLSYKDLLLFASAVAKKPALGKHVAGFLAGASVYHDREMTEDHQHPFGKDALTHLIPHLTQLTSFCSHLPITPHELVVLCANASSTLKAILTRLHCGDPDERPTMEFLTRVERLEELELACFCQCGALFEELGSRKGSGKKGRKGKSKAASRTTTTATQTRTKLELPRLKMLCLNRMKDEQVWNFFSHAELPALETMDTDSCDLQVAQPFFTTHGSKIKTLSLEGLAFDGDVLHHCPNVTKLALVSLQDPPCHDFLVSDMEHKSLETITFSVASPRMFHSYFKPTKQWQDFFSGVQLGSLPALKSFTMERFEWPTREHAIAHCKLVKGAEDLKRKWNVDLMDDYGKRWSSRLKKRR